MFRKKLLGFIICIGLVSSCVSCNKESNNNAKIDRSSTYTCRYAIEYDEESGWMYDIEVDYVDGEADYFFSGSNVKYPRLEGYGLHVYDESYNLIDISEVQMPALCHEKDYKYKDDIANIETFLKENNFEKEVTLEEIESIEQECIKDEILLKLYNKIVGSEELTEFGKFYRWDGSYMVEEPEYVDGYRLIWTYHSGYGYMYNNNVELQYEDGTYLSDLVREGKATDEQVELYNKLKEICAEVVETQMFPTEDICEITYGNVKFSRLYDIYQELKEESKEFTDPEVDI